MIVKHLISCSRCEEDHRNVTFSRLDRPFAPTEAAPLSWKWWAPCPTNGQPILMVVTDDVVIDKATKQVAKLPLPVDPVNLAREFLSAPARLPIRVFTAFTLARTVIEQDDQIAKLRRALTTMLDEYPNDDRVEEIRKLVTP